MRKILVIVLAVLFLVACIGIIVFHFALDLSWIESIYFVITTITTVGYGDISLKDAATPVKVFGNFLMIAGACSLAAVFGIITDFLLQTRLQEFLGKRKRIMKNHIVLCGLGNIGIRVLEYLLTLNEDVVVVERNENGRFIHTVRTLKVPLVLGDIRHTSTLEEANIRHARCLIGVSDDDLANLEAALNARSVNEDIRVVLRLFDANLAEKVKSGFHVQTALSTSALSAPAFAMAAFDPDVIGSMYIGDDLLFNLKLKVKTGSRFCSTSISTMKDILKISVLAHDSGSDGNRQYHPPGSLIPQAGDTLYITADPEACRKLREMNTAS